MKKILLISLLIIPIIIVAGCTSSKSSTGAATTESGLVKIPLNEVTKDVKKYTYNAQGTKVTYFVVKGSDGEVRTAFDACDVCSGSQGYYQSGGDITCRKCGRVFRIDGLGTKNQGYGCWPSYLSHKIKDGKVVIKTADIVAGKHRFV